ncbi:hypothetical protein P153DRAFT_294133 [Dothidotthia symphoricarpi CBS 119687]|uniref:histidine kinase n=1 Tax=Dothidotthia symphoricarpi CBS 119687 TaxID=1392245 RepID=A0A6A6AAC0_9PLEO|nr:uncharacterized protein P153DRAFT_294133 [Dothidotthia symphoricarpi CBS 119687]KAF2128163.1 hypothetical protein P153DRAFT_294133 [Dothidotthia symphoricarpi CBS 119687]
MLSGDDDTGSDDWLDTLPQTEHGRFFRQTDWAGSRLGPTATWNPTLRLFTGFVLADSRPACMWWGPDRIAIYNETYKTLAAGLHPALMGATFEEGYPKLDVRSYFEQARTSGAGVDVLSGACLVLERNGFPEETFFSASVVPIGPVYRPEGFYNTASEVTSQKLVDRRTSMLNALASVPAQTVHAVTAHILATLRTNPKDIPLAMLYHISNDVVRLQGHIGLPAAHRLIVTECSLDNREGLLPDMRRAGHAALIIDCDDRFDAVDWQGWGSPAAKIAILPIMSGSLLVGYLVLGTNPYRPYDEGCQQFIRDVHRMVSSIVSSAIVSDNTKQRQDQLEADLAFSDLKLRHLINHASVGMCHVSLEGDMLWANDHYYALAGSTAEAHKVRMSMFNPYLDEDRHIVLKLWEELLAGVEPKTVECRLKRLYTSPSGDSTPAEIQILAFPYRDPATLEVKGVMACTTDISRLKWAQTFQARLAAEAREAKRQQEAFIDVVSHEMRNPLSAIVHCADSIVTAIEECRVQLSRIPEPVVGALDDNLQSARIIMQCADHQKRIIDDVLTLSKLDSMLLSIIPSAVKPTKLIGSIADIFEAELKSNHIHYSVNADDSLTKLGIDYLLLDPSRVTQIFINLLTNAIKFVKPSKKPFISIKFGARVSNPRAFFPENMFWANESKKNGDVTSNPEWGSGEEVYLAFSVQDSGIGLKEHEIHQIFERFKQANVRTHVKYGGSGLGLFISKELTEKQGGEVGVSSVFGEGSTFGFYVKTRRVERQPESLETMSNDNKSISGTHQLQVLLVEDNLINQQVLGKQLKRAGCVVEVANHGLEALNVLEQKTFDVVLMDLEMPVMNGLEAMRRIRKKEATGESWVDQSPDPCARRPTRLPVIAVTANVRQEQIDTAIAAGADRVMQKPFKAADLVYLIKSLLPSPASNGVPKPGPNDTPNGFT